MSPALPSSVEYQIHGTRRQSHRVEITAAARKSVFRRISVGAVPLVRSPLPWRKKKKIYKTMFEPKK